MKTLRNYSTYTILKNINNPVMFLGFPLKLAMIYMSVVIVSCLCAMILTNTGVNIWINISIPMGFALVGISFIKRFYKKYGVDGFYFEQRDRQLPKSIEGDKSCIDIMKSILDKNTKKY